MEEPFEKKFKKFQTNLPLNLHLLRKKEKERKKKQESIYLNCVVGPLYRPTTLEDTTWWEVVGSNIYTGTAEESTCHRAQIFIKYFLLILPQSRYHQLT